MKTRVVVTGIGIVSPIGIGVDAFWRAALEGVSGVQHISTFDASPYATQFGGQVRGFDATAYVPRSRARRMSRASQYAVAAAMMACRDARLEVGSLDPEDVAVYLGVGMGGMDKIEEELQKFFGDAAETMSPTGVGSSIPSAPAGNISVELDLHGEVITFSTGCSSSANAIGHAYRSIRSGLHRVVLSGGTEVGVTPALLASYSRARAISRRNSCPEEASRPFDKHRDGFVLADGAAILILEDLSSAERRGADVYAEILGYGATSDAHNMFTVNEDGRDASRAVARALRESGIGQDRIDYINAHGSSSVAADRRETKLIKDVLGPRARSTPVSSVKSMMGHPMGASGGFQTAVCALSIKEGLIPPTINYDTPDPDCDLDYVPNEARSEEVRVALNLSLGAGGNNACLAVGAV